MAQAVESKRKRNDSCALCASLEDVSCKRRVTEFLVYKPSAPSTFPLNLRDLPSVSAHTTIPYNDQEWPEHRTVSFSPIVDCVPELPSLLAHTTLPHHDADWQTTTTLASCAIHQEDVLWVCGQLIPSLSKVWPSRFKMGEAARRKKMERLVQEAESAFHLRARRRKFVQSRKHLSLLAKEKVANARRRQELFRQYILPIKLGQVTNPLRVRACCSLYQARISAIAEHERLRRDADTYDQPSTQIAHLDFKAIDAWQQSNESDLAPQSVKLRFRVCAEGINDMPSRPIWLVSKVVTILSLDEPKLVCKNLLAQAKTAYCVWVLGQPVQEQRTLLEFRLRDGSVDGGKLRTARADISVAGKGVRGLRQVSDVTVWERFLDGVFEDSRRRKGDGSAEAGLRQGEAKGLLTGVDEDMDGVVRICVRPPSSKVVGLRHEVQEVCA